MYKAFYNLKRNPFEITPDPSFLFPTRRHNEALAALYYGVRRHKGFVVMTGEVGTGKTLLVRCLLELLNRRSVAYAYVFNSLLARRWNSCSMSPAISGWPPPARTRASCCSS